MLWAIHSAIQAPSPCLDEGEGATWFSFLFQLESWFAPVPQEGAVVEAAVEEGGRMRKGSS